MMRFHLLPNDRERERERDGRERRERETGEIWRERERREERGKKCVSVSAVVYTGLTATLKGKSGIQGVRKVCLHFEKEIYLLVKLENDGKFKLTKKS